MLTCTRSKWPLFAVVIVIGTLAQPVHAQKKLGVTLQQGEHHPVVVSVIPKTAASCLRLKPDDEILTAISDPIKTADGVNARWAIQSIGHLQWVLGHTKSKIGLIVRRGDEFIEATAIYRVTTPVEGPKGEWVLEDGPKQVNDPRR